MDQFEKCLIDICAPTLAGIKMGSLFWLPDKNGAGDPRIRLWDDALSPKGVRVTALKTGTNGRLIYVYRPAEVEAMLCTDEIVLYLREKGYGTRTAANDTISELCERIRNEKVFPHEIGLFLGYPLHDVTGFIENAGRNACYSGFWKVYRDRPSAERLFQQFKRCISLYQTLFMSGRSVLELTKPQYPPVKQPDMCYNTCQQKQMEALRHVE